MGSLSPLNAASLPDEQWTPATAPQGDGWRSLFVSDASTLNREPSTLYAQSSSQNGSNANPTFHCATVDSPKCVELNQIALTAFLQPCSTSITTNCIESFYALTSSGVKIPAVNPVEYPAQAEWDFDGNDAINLPTGGSPAIWEIPGATHGGGGNSYMVQALVNGQLNKAVNTKVSSEKFQFHNLIVQVTPVKIISGQYVRQIAQDSTQTSPGIGRGVRHDSIDEWRFCSMIDNGTCSQRQPFPEGYRFGVKLRLQEKLTGWLHGRIYNPDVDITTNAAGGQSIEVLASPVKVPVIGEWFKWDQLSQAIQGYILAGKVYGGQGFHDTKALPTGNFQEIIDTSGQGSLDVVSLWLPQIGDKASATQSTWSFKSLSYADLSGANSCIRDARDLVGFVTTNAAVYSAGPPAFNADLQSLDYKVIAPHYTAQGEIFRGTYDLRIRGEVARCIYGFNSAPIQASISIISEDGTTQSATQTINEVDGWLSLSANGFTYSAPTIQVKLSQKAAAPEPTATPTPTASSTPAASPVAKRTITCLKGKVKRKITAIKPACPKGFRKAS